ncbi:hemoglobin subunit alpha-like [Leucoraja erinacea]|uniref:hemoglobin subunit alpha-like n=1 Tax=Leucoraja erinaceus TaxID=7782 RepID=UPI0024571E22|nr:hemoglobin subunit alpha-like [Leucoraja erinacea]
MVLSESNKQVIHQLAETLRANAAVLGADALARLFELHPQTKTYFPSFTGYHAADPHVIAHGTKVFEALAKAAEHLDDLPHHLDKLAERHGHELLVDPHNFVLFSNIIVVTLALHLPSFTPATHTAIDKFLEEVAHQLSSKYR